MPRAEHFIVSWIFLIAQTTAAISLAKGPQGTDPGALPARGYLENETAQAVQEAVEVAEVEPVAAEGIFDSQGVPRVDRAVNIFLPRATRPKSILVMVDHRASNTFVSKNAGRDYLGLDGGLKVGIGLRYGIIDGLDAGLYRLSDGHNVAFDTYELDARWAFLSQAKHHLNLALRAGLSVFVQPDAKDPVASGFFGQLLADRVFFDRLLVGAGFLFHSQSTNDEKSSADDEFSGALAGMLELRILSKLAWDFEIAANVLGYGSLYPAMSTSIKLLTYRHTFAVVISNDQFISADGIVTNTWRKLDELIFGFQLSREINF